jgi:DNA replication protein DnaC
MEGFIIMKEEEDMSNIFPECSDCVVQGLCKFYSGECIPKSKSSCSTLHRISLGLKLSNIPKQYYKANRSFYVQDDNNKHAYERVEPYFNDIISTVEKGTNIVFFGNCYGTGKTFHASLLLNHYIYNACQTDKFDFETPVGMFVVYPELIDDLRYLNNDYEVQMKMHAIKNVPLLLLDDIGAGTMSDFAREQTYLIINQRYNNGLSTIITANYTPNELVQDHMLGARIVSRIFNNCIPIKLEGSDRRLSIL